MTRARAVGLASRIECSSIDLISCAGRGGYFFFILMETKFMIARYPGDRCYLLALFSVLVCRGWDDQGPDSSHMSSAMAIQLGSVIVCRQ